MTRLTTPTASIWIESATLQLRLENGIYIPYVDDSMGGSDYARWMFSLLHPGGDIGVQQTYILFGLRDGVESFLRSFGKISPKTTIVEVER